MYNYFFNAFLMCSKNCVCLELQCSIVYQRPLQGAVFQSLRGLLHGATLPSNSRSIMHPHQPIYLCSYAESKIRQDLHVFVRLLPNQSQRALQIHHITFLRFASSVVGNNFQPKWWFNGDHYGSKLRFNFFGAKRSPSTNCESTTNEATKNTDSHPWPRSIKLLLTSKKTKGVDIVARKGMSQNDGKTIQI